MLAPPLTCFVSQASYVTSPLLTFAEWLLLCAQYVLTALYTRFHFIFTIASLGDIYI